LTERAVTTYQSKPQLLLGLILFWIVGKFYSVS